MNIPLLLKKANQHFRAKNYSVAEKTYSKILKKHPNNSPAIIGLANIHIVNKDPKAVINLFAKLDKKTRSIPSIANAYSMAHNNIGSQLQHQHDEQAIAHFKSALALNHHNQLASANLIQMYIDNKAWEQAETTLLSALDKNLFHPTLLHRLVDILLSQFESLKALNILQKANALGFPIATEKLAQTLVACNETEKARPLYQQLSQKSQDLTALLGYHLSLPAIYADAEQIKGQLSYFQKGLDCVYDTIKDYTINRDHINQLSWSNFYFAYLGISGFNEQKKYAAIITELLNQATPELMQPLPRSNRKRIGLISSFFRNCTVGAYFGSWILELVTAGFEVDLFCLGTRQDALTQHFAATVKQCHYLNGELINDANHIKAAQLDLIIYPEIGMDSKTFLLAAMRLAPIQCCAWGHPITTGLPTIDYYFSVEGMETADAQKHYTEELITLPGIGTCYSPAKYSLPQKTHFNLAPGKHYYCMPQSPFKWHPDNDDFILSLIENDPKSLMIMFEGPDKVLSHHLQTRLKSLCTTRHLDYHQHFQIFPMLPREKYLQLNSLCHVMLDTLHWSGGNTALDAFSVGLPIVTLPGKLMRGRQTMAMLNLLEWETQITHSKAQYIAKVIDIASTKNATTQKNRIIHAQILFNDPHPNKIMSNKIKALIE